MGHAAKQGNVPGSPSSLETEKIVMNKDRIAGSAKELKGTIKERAGRLFGDSKLEVDGKIDKAEGKVQNAIDGLWDTLKK